MPRLLEKTKRIRAKRFLGALERTGSPAKAALEVLEIGSRGAKDIKHSAESAGSQMLSRIEPSMVEALLARGVNPDKIAGHIKDLLDSQDPMWIDKGIDKSLKVGIGGGYAAEKHQNLNVNVEVGTPIPEEAIAIIEADLKKKKT